MSEDLELLVAMLQANGIEGYLFFHNGQVNKLVGVCMCGSTSTDGRDESF